MADRRSNPVARGDDYPRELLLLGFGSSEPGKLRRKPMQFLESNQHGPVLCPETEMLGKILWYLLRASDRMDAACSVKVKEGGGPFFRLEPTAFGREVGGDEIHWWVFEKERELDALEAQTAESLRAAQGLKANSALLKQLEPSSYMDVLLALKEFTQRNRSEIEVLLKYLVWLQQRNELAPSVVFTYRVWLKPQRRSFRRTHG